jgi:hypothetical protein
MMHKFNDIDNLTSTLKSCFLLNNPHETLHVPDSWNDVKEFATWWIKANMPMAFSKDSEIFITDDATTTCLFKKGRWQVELYLIHPCPIAPIHEHPGVEVVQMRLDSKKHFVLTEILHRGEAHGAGKRNENEILGFPLIAFEHWQDREPCTIAAMWKGKTVGPKQEALIRRFHPDAYVVDGYADITRKKEE